MRTLLISCLLYVNFFVYAGEISWHQGSIVLQDNSVLVGFISVDPRFHLVLFQNQDNTTTVFAAYMVKQVRIYDESADINRKYVSLANDQGVELFEVVLSGAIDVCRQIRPGFELSENVDRDSYRYFIVKDGKLNTLHTGKRKLWDEMTKNFPSIEGYAKNMKLDRNSSADVLVLIKYYNHSLRNESMLISSSES